MHTRFLGSSLLAFGCFAATAFARPVPNDIATGLRLSEQYCITCHVVVASKERGWTDAPSFTALANRPGVTAEKLSAVVQKPHMNMLNDQRPKDEADAIGAYIMSLRRR